MTKIEWTEKTWNPIIGCRKISPGCANCYAEKMARRLAEMGNKSYQAVIDAGRWNGEWSTNPSVINKPLRRKTPTMWFVNSMSDLFYTIDAESDLVDIWNIMRLTPQHTYQILTKYTKNMLYLVTKMVDKFGVLQNVWLGVSAENQKYADERIPTLLQVPAAMRFVSAEPLLGAIDFSSYLEHPRMDDLDWLIVGGESGAGARPMNPNWVRSIRDQCIAADTPFFFKQWGEWDEFGRKVGKKRARRLLDGREWKEMPNEGAL